MTLVRHSRVNLSFTMNRNEKVEQHIRHNTRKHNVLNICIESGVIPLYVAQFSLL